MKTPQPPAHTNWLVDTGKRLKTMDEKDVVKIWEFCHKRDEAVLSAWAKHFRNHYCLDSKIDNLRRGYKYSRAEYLNKIKFPDPRIRLGQSVSFPVKWTVLN